ncbi:unnamed protein product [Protopolystoma xenopodis]|uniref:Bestrophin homolog n=1 Tax=Protopolystoma xenopodis TaxID=117903 RepID=A0A448XIJ9_9PLAT|nr:unnamed protein product [Protopolystoma xenopodis]
MPQPNKPSSKGRHFVLLNERVVFLRLLFRWKGSIWRLLLGDLVFFIISYFLVTMAYRYVLISYPNLKLGFEGFVSYMDKIANLVPVSFLLGFFVSTILTRWWAFVRSIPGMTSPAFLVHAFVGGEEQEVDSTGFRIRRTLMRYMNLAWILAMIKLSWSIRNRFLLRHFPESRLMEKGKRHQKSAEDRRAFKLCICASNKQPKGKVRTAQIIQVINEDSSIKKFFGQIITQEEAEIFLEIEREEGEKYACLGDITANNAFFDC